MENKGLKIILSLIVIVMCVYFISTSAWFRRSPCPEGTRLVETVWTDAATGTQNVSSICVQGD